MLQAAYAGAQKNYGADSGLTQRAGTNLLYQQRNVPAMHADNVEVAARVTYQISIVTSDDDYFAIEDTVKKVMDSLGFLRVDSVELREDNDYIRVLRFCVAQV